MAEEAGPTSKLVRVKVEGSPLLRSKLGYSTPVYAEPPELFPVTNSKSYSRKEFAEKYGLHASGISPKQLKGEDCSEEELESFFGPVVNKNGHRYMFLNDEALIAEIERLWMIVHQNNLVLASRMITKGMARGLYVEKKKNRKVNWAAYAEWTNSEQLRRRLKLRKQGRAGDECDLTDDEDDMPTEEGGSTLSKFSQQEGGSIYDRQGFEVASGPHAMGEVLELWKKYLLYAVEEHGKVSRSLLLETKAKDEFMVAECRAKSQMEFCFQKLGDARDKLDALNAGYEAGRDRFGESTEPSEDEARSLDEYFRQIEKQKGLIEVFEGLAKDAEAEHRRVSDTESGVCAKVSRLQTSLLQADRNEVAIKLLLGRLEAGSYLFRFVTPIPYIGWETPDPKEWLPLDKCSFCGLGFAPVWAVKLASCKHAYHELCARIHFQTSTVCSEIDCKEEMHDKWWSSVGFLKPGVDTVLEIPKVRPVAPKLRTRATGTSSGHRLSTVVNLEPRFQQEDVLEPTREDSTTATTAPAPSGTTSMLPATPQPSASMGSIPTEVGASSTPSQFNCAPGPGSTTKVVSVLTSAHLKPKERPNSEKTKPRGPPKEKPKAATRVDPNEATELESKEGEEESSGDEEDIAEKVEQEGDSQDEEKDSEDEHFDSPPPKSQSKRKGNFQKRISSIKKKGSERTSKRQKVPIAERKSNAKGTRAAIKNSK